MGKSSLALKIPSHKPPTHPAVYLRKNKKKRERKISNGKWGERGQKRKTM